MSATSAVTLYEIADNLPCLLESLDLTEEASQERVEIEAAIQTYMQILPAKVDAVCHVLAQFEALEEFGAAEIKRLRERVERIRRERERLESYCVRTLEQLPEPKRGARKLEGEGCSLSLHRSERLKILDESAIPLEFKSAVVQVPMPIWQIMMDALDQTAREHVLRNLEKQDVKVREIDVKRALKAGAEVSGADLEFPNNLVRK